MYRERARRPLRLAGYDYRRAGTYFVTVCVQDRLGLLGDVRGEGVALSPAGAMVEATWRSLATQFTEVALDAYVVMPNHLHGVIVLKSAEQGLRTVALPDLMQRFKSWTTRHYFDGVTEAGWPGVRGRLWQRGYFEHIVRHQVELDRIRAYIEKNPLRWHLDRENLDAQAGAGEFPWEA